MTITTFFGLLLIPSTLLIGFVVSFHLVTPSLDPLIKSLDYSNITELTRITQLVITKLEANDSLAAPVDVAVLKAFIETSPVKLLISQLGVLQEKYAILTPQDVTSLETIYSLVNSGHTFFYEVTLAKLLSLSRKQVELINESTTRIADSFVNSTKIEHTSFIREVITPDDTTLFKSIINNVLCSIENLSEEACLKLMDRLNVDSVQLLNDYVFLYLYKKSLPELAKFVYNTKDILAYSSETLQFASEKASLFVEYFPYSTLSIVDLCEKTDPVVFLPIFHKEDKTVLLLDHFPGLIKNTVQTVFDPQLVLGNFHPFLSKWVQTNCNPNFDVNVFTARFIPQISNDPGVSSFDVDNFAIYSFDFLSTLELYPVFNLICV